MPAFLCTYFSVTIDFTHVHLSNKHVLDGVQNRFVRSILGIKAAYISRVSNQEVLRRAGHTKASDMLLRRQVSLYGKVVRSAEHGIMRRVSFIPRSTRPATDQYVRRVGRPRKEWVPFVQEKIRRHVPNIEAADTRCMDTKLWREFIVEYF